MSAGSVKEWRKEQNNSREDVVHKHTHNNKKRVWVYTQISFWTTSAGLLNFAAGFWCVTIAQEPRNNHGGDRLGEYTHPRLVLTHTHTQVHITPWTGITFCVYNIVYQLCWSYMLTPLHVASNIDPSHLNLTCLLTPLQLQVWSCNTLSGDRRFKEGNIFSVEKKKRNDKRLDLKIKNQKKKQTENNKIKCT